MSRVLYSYTYHSSWPSAAIGDARAFRVGDSDKVHRPASLAPNMVTSVCGIWAAVVETDARVAHWADSKVTCKRCLK